MLDHLGWCEGIPCDSTATHALAPKQLLDSFLDVFIQLLPFHFFKNYYIERYNNN